MKVTKVSFGVTRKGAEPYTSDRADVEMTLEEGDTFQEAMSRCKFLCRMAVGEVSESKIADAKRLLEEAGQL